MGNRSQHIAYRGAGQPALWASAPAPAVETIVSGAADVRLYRGWLSKERADALLATLLAQTRWVDESRMMYGKRVRVPRQQAWYGDDRAASWPPDLLAVRRELEVLEGRRFHHVLLNRYRDGRDSVAWHSDHEVDHLREAVIASLTLGVTRPFDLRPKIDRRRVITVELDHGDLLIMAGRTQATYEHRVAKDPRIGAQRINLTFRQI
ncbi:MAG TPA: alpha-ketoglutarate-dependent dioxygenase AlkB [Candidatus Acidoferrales bacterium]|nr:alpha-ketoglutarate-dependent dioxygenase AlkB [Candidatus Acidoferrales bacterium]